MLLTKPCIHLFRYHSLEVQHSVELAPMINTIQFKIVYQISDGWKNAQSTQSDLIRNAGFRMHRSTADLHPCGTALYNHMVRN